MDDSLQDHLQSMLNCIRFFHQKGWAPATSTNYSFRLSSPNRIWISASGIDKGHIRESDFMAIDTQGIPLTDPRKPSAETGLHTLLYRLRPTTGAVLHTHSIFGTVLSQVYAKQGALPIQGLEVQKGISGIRSHEETLVIPIFWNSQDMVELSKRIEQRDQKEGAKMQAFLLAGHGLYTWGPNISVAKRHVEAIEFLLECHYKISTFPVTTI